MQIDEALRQKHSRLVVMPPYRERKLTDGRILREFSQDVSNHELEWHMDRNDREVVVVEGRGWKLQLESGLPFDLTPGETYSIPRESWHRVVKGSSPLRILINEGDPGIFSTTERDAMKSKTIEILPTHDVKVNEAWSRLGSDVAILERRGYSVEERNKYVFDKLAAMERQALHEQAGFDMFRGVKKMVADKVASAVGVPDGFLKNIITNFVAGLGIADLRLMFQSGACSKIVTKLAAAVQGAIVDTIMKSLGLAPENFLTIAITEGIKSGFVENGPFVKKASEVICKINISDLLPGGISNLFGKKGSKVSDKDAAAATAAAPADGSAPAVPTS
jgi:hypothetical protein